MFDFLYKTDDLKELLGNKYCGPNSMEHGKEVRIAVFESNKGDDGYKVELYCISLPARFFTIKALDTENSVGELRTGFYLSTGSGCGEEAVKIAEMINNGMLSGGSITDLEKSNNK